MGHSYIGSYESLTSTSTNYLSNINISLGFLNVFVVAEFPQKPQYSYANWKPDSCLTKRTAAKEDVVDNFRAGKTWVLIATDVMARGMDFKGVNCVINYDFPESAAAYIHRIGRSGRAGRPGEAITLFTEEDKPFLRNIANVMKDSGCEVPAWMLALPKLRKKKHRPKRASVGAEPDESEG
ncbi:hypothetical protein HPP92_008240 [Vanilla planifolia]|uniref:RNA helicase n=1 Tax=Vanilla planifolia TaxID=51239 RepID=A0A835V720_VANPL|nr:hypothetical protein HPP92_008240 [Vanilla planifolia]